MPIHQFFRSALLHQLPQSAYKFFLPHFYFKLIILKFLQMTMQRYNINTKLFWLKILETNKIHLQLTNGFTS